MGAEHAIGFIVGVAMVFLMYLGLSGQFADLENLIAHGHTVIVSHQSETYKACIGPDKP